MPDISAALVDAPAEFAAEAVGTLPTPVAEACAVAFAALLARRDVMKRCIVSVLS